MNWLRRHPGLLILVGSLMYPLWVLIWLALIGLALMAMIWL